MKNVYTNKVRHYVPSQRLLFGLIDFPHDNVYTLVHVPLFLGVIVSLI